MDSRAKQRVTGAVILVALFVLLVPELLTGPHDDAAPANAPAEEGMRNYTIDLDAPANAAQPMSAAPEPAVTLPPVAANPMAESLPGSAVPRWSRRRRPRNPRRHPRARPRPRPSRRWRRRPRRRRRHPRPPARPRAPRPQPPHRRVRRPRLQNPNAA